MIPEDVDCFTDADWARVVMAKLEKLDWRFSLNDAGQLTVVKGRTPAKVPQEAVMALLHEWSHYCEYCLLQSRVVH